VFLTHHSPLGEERCWIGGKGKVKSAYEPSDPSGWSLSRFL